VRLIVDNPSNPAASSVGSLPAPSTPAAAVESTDWVKPAIANLLNRAIPDESARVRVENVDYGTWIWNEKEQLHEHAPFKTLRSQMGKEQAQKFNELLPVVKATWDDVRIWRNVSLD
jgi:hypothetical protein